MCPQGLETTQEARGIWKWNPKLHFLALGPGELVDPVTLGSKPSGHRWLNKGLVYYPASCPVWGRRQGWPDLPRKKLPPGLLAWQFPTQSLLFAVSLVRDHRLVA